MSIKLDLYNMFNNIDKGRFNILLKEFEINKVVGDLSVGELYILDYECHSYIDFRDGINTVDGSISYSVSHFCLKPVMYLGKTTEIKSTLFELGPKTHITETYCNYNFLYNKMIFKIRSFFIDFCMLYMCTEGLINKLLEAEKFL